MLKWIILYILGGIVSWGILMVIFAANCKRITGMSAREYIKSLGLINWKDLLKFPLYIVMWPILFPIGIWGLIETIEVCNMLKRISKELEES